MLQLKLSDFDKKGSYRQEILIGDLKGLECKAQLVPEGRKNMYIKRVGREVGGSGRHWEKGKHDQNTLFAKIVIKIKRSKLRSPI